MTHGGLQICNSRREPDFRDETAAGSGSDAQRGIVDRGDGPHDREPETHAVTVCTAIALQSLKRQQKSLDLFRGNGRAGVGDSERRPGPGVEPGPDVHVPSWDVVTQRVVDEVPDQALEQAPVTLNRSALQRGADL